MKLPAKTLIDYYQSVDNAKPVLIMCHDCEQAWISRKDRMERSIRLHKGRMKAKRGFPCDSSKIDIKLLQVEDMV